MMQPASAANANTDGDAAAMAGGSPRDFAFSLPDDEDGAQNGDRRGGGGPAFDITPPQKPNPTQVQA